jgi:hypothetical protein
MSTNNLTSPKSWRAKYWDEVGEITFPWATGLTVLMAALDWKTKWEAAEWIGTWIGFAIAAGVVGMFLAHSRIAEQKKYEAEQAELDMANAKRKTEEERVARLKESADQLTAEKHSVERGEIIRKLGSCGDMLELLKTTTDPERVILIAQGAKKELRELVAKYPVKELEAIVERDMVVRKKLDGTLAKAQERNLDSDDVDVLAGVLGLRRNKSAPAKAQGFADVTATPKVANDARR